LQDIDKRNWRCVNHRG